MAKVSVVIPVYNTEKYLIQCLNSIINQTLLDIEIILIDDGSTDESGNICDQFSKEDVRFLTYHISNGGVSNARNCGIKYAHSKYVMFVDSDDWIEPEMCALLYEYAEKHHAKFVICGNYNEASSGTTFQKLFNIGDQYFENDEYYDNILYPTLGLVGNKLSNPEKLDKLTPVWARLYRTDLINSNDIKFVDLHLLPSECLQFNFEYCIHCNCAVYIDKPLYHYRRNTAMSVTKLYRIGLLAKWEWWFSNMAAFLNGHHANEPLYKAFHSRVCCSIIPLGGNALKLKKYRLIRHEMQTFLHCKIIKEAFLDFDASGCPFYWKIFFFSAKHCLTDLFIALTWCMRQILKSRKV